MTTCDSLQQVEKALRVVYGALLPRMCAREASARLGYGRPSYARAMTQTSTFYRDLAKDLGETWTELMERADREEYGSRRFVREHMEDAAAEILDVVRKMPKPMRDVLVRKACGMTWKQIGAAMPNRARFSLMDDWQAALNRVGQERFDCVRRLV